MAIIGVLINFLVIQAEHPCECTPTAKNLCSGCWARVKVAEYGQATANGFGGERLVL